VSFRLCSSLTRTEDKLGDRVEFTPGDENLHKARSLNAVIRFGKKTGERLVPVKLLPASPEVGTLETLCESKVTQYAGDCNSSCAKLGRACATQNRCV